jgi:hypothetical protein
MKHQRHFDTPEAAQREAVQIWKMIVDLDRTVQPLNCDIVTEEELAGISDRSHTGLSDSSRTLAARRDNLRDTVTELERRLSNLDQLSWSPN